MGMERKVLLRLALVAALCAGVVYAGYIGFQVIPAWRQFKAEDQIHGTYWAVISAVYAFAEKHDRPPARLAELVPTFIPSIPECELVRQVTYRVEADGKNWRIELCCDALGEPRIYCWRSRDEYTDEEKQREVRRYHGSWVVLTAR